MTQEKLKNLSDYSRKLRERLNSPIPKKHLQRPEAYKAFLTRELSITNMKLDLARLASAEKGAK